MLSSIDFSNCVVDKTRIYGGANGSKLGIIFNGKNYMIKFAPKADQSSSLSSTNSCVSEYVGCHIFKLLGIPVQDTILGKYAGKQVVACVDLESNGFILKDFASLKNTIIDSEHNGYGTELSDILFTLNTQNLINPFLLTNFFWEMFIADALLGNFDRHNGNWSFLVNRSTGEIKLSPIYDCGSCLYPKLDESTMKAILKDENEINRRIFEFPNSAIKQYGKKINYYQLLMTTDNSDCLKALRTIGHRINLANIDKIIDDTPDISETHKLFLKVMVLERKKKIIDAALAKHGLTSISDSSKFS